MSDKYSPQDLKAIDELAKMSQTVATTLRTLPSSKHLRQLAQLTANRLDQFRDKAFSSARNEELREEMYVVTQHFPTLKWQIVPVTVDQGEAMLRRGEKAYRTIADARIARAEILQSKLQTAS